MEVLMTVDQKEDRGSVLALDCARLWLACPRGVHSLLLRISGLLVFLECSSNLWGMLLLLWRLAVIHF